MYIEIHVNFSVVHINVLMKQAHKKKYRTYLSKKKGVVSLLDYFMWYVLL